MEITKLPGYRCILGEGPLWDHGNEHLYWVDAHGSRVCRYDWVSDVTETKPVPAPSIGSLAVRKDGGLILAMGTGFHAFDFDTGDCSPIALPLKGRRNVRMNDGKVDPQGRFVCGSMHTSLGGPAGGMYRLDADLGVELMLDGFVCFNGPCFSPDGRKIYLTGRSLESIEAFDYGDALTNGCVLIDGMVPDGATVDAEGFIWSAQWDEQAVVRISPDGEVAGRVDLPGYVVSSVMFAGPELDTLVATTLGMALYSTVPPAGDSGATLLVRGGGFRGLPEYSFLG